MKKLNEKIKSHLSTVKPKSKWEFVTMGLIRDLVLAGLIVLAILILGIIVYTLRQYNPWENLPQGVKYYFEAVKSMPWELILFGLIIIGLVYLGVRKLHTLYRINPIYIACLILLLIVCGYFIAESMGLNKKVAEMPVAKNIYKKQGKIILVSRGVVIAGQVKSIQVPALVVVDPKNKMWQIITTSKTHILSKDKIENYDYVVVNGIKIDNENIEAFMVREMDENWRGFYEDIMKARSMQCPGCTK